MFKVRHGPPLLHCFYTAKAIPPLLPPAPPSARGDRKLSHDSRFAFSFKRQHMLNISYDPLQSVCGAMTCARGACALQARHDSFLALPTVILLLLLRMICEDMCGSLLDCMLLHVPT